MKEITKSYFKNNKEARNHLSEVVKERYKDETFRNNFSYIMKNRNNECLKGVHKGKKYLTDGFVNVFVKPEYWCEFIDIGFNFGRTILNNKKKK